MAAALAASRADYEAIDAARAALEEAQLEAALAASLALEEHRAATEREAKVRDSQVADEEAAAAPSAPPSPAVVAAPQPVPATVRAAAPRQSKPAVSSSLPSLHDNRAQSGPAAQAQGPSLPPIDDGHRSSDSFLPPLSAGTGTHAYISSSSSGNTDSEDWDALLAEGAPTRQRQKASGVQLLQVTGAAVLEDPEERKRHLQELRLALRAQKTAERAAALSAATGGGVTSGIQALPTSPPPPAVAVAGGGGGDTAAQEEAARRTALAAKIRAEVVGTQ
jgi:hypothetical protein